MRYKIENLKDITDSREILQSSPKGFSKIMTYIILALVICMVTWSCFAHKEITVTAAGVVRPSGSINKISSSLAGSISEINVKDGDLVKQGDTLIVIDGYQYKLQKDILQKSLDDKNKTLELIKRLKSSILENTNQFNQDSDEEKEYSKKYELFNENLNSSNNQTLLCEQQKSELNNEISNLELFKKAVAEGKNYFNEGSSFYYQFKDYELSLNSYDEQIKSCERDINTPGINEANLVQLKSNLQNYKVEKDKLKNTTIVDTLNRIEQDKAKLSQLQVSSSTGSYKEQYIADLDSKISALQSSIDEVEVNLESVNSQLDSASIKAASDGVVNMISNLSVGDFIQIGGEIASIVPQDESGFQVDVYIDSQSLGSIKEDQDVIIELVSLPSSEYGYIKSNLSNISVDTKNIEKASYYTATCLLNERSLENKKGEIVDIRNGMIAQVKIVERKITYFRYFLEQLDILN